MEINEILRETRKQHGFSQKQLAEKIGTNPVVISSWECGKKIPTQESIDKIASALKMDSRECFAFKKNLGYKLSPSEVISFTQEVLGEFPDKKPIDVFKESFNLSQEKFEKELSKNKKDFLKRLEVMKSLTENVEYENDNDQESIAHIALAFDEADEYGRKLMAEVCEAIGKAHSQRENKDKIFEDELYNSYDDGYYDDDD